MRRSGALTSRLSDEASELSGSLGLAASLVEAVKAEGVGAEFVATPELGSPLLPLQEPVQAGPLSVMMQVIFPSIERTGWSLVTVIRFAFESQASSSSPNWKDAL